MVYIQIVEEWKQNRINIDTQEERRQKSKTIDPTTRDSKKLLWKKFSKYGLDNVTRYPKDWIAELEILRKYLQKIYLHIDNTKTTMNIWSNLPESNKNTVESIEDKLDDYVNTLTIERICDKISVEYDQINLQ